MSFFIPSRQDDAIKLGLLQVSKLGDMATSKPRRLNQNISLLLGLLSGRVINNVMLRKTGECHKAKVSS